MPRFILALIALALAAPLTSFGAVPIALPVAVIGRSAAPRLVVVPIPAKARDVYSLRLQIATSARARQDCTYNNASSRLTETVYDDLGMGSYPYGQVSAWSCTSSASVQAEMDTRITQMRADIEQYHVYRKECLAAGAPGGCPWPKP